MSFNSPPETSLAGAEPLGPAEQGLHAWPERPFVSGCRQSVGCAQSRRRPSARPLRVISSSSWPYRPGPRALQEEHCGHPPAGPADSRLLLHRATLVLAPCRASAQTPSMAPYRLCRRLWALPQGPLSTALTLVPRDAPTSGDCPNSVDRGALSHTRGLRSMFPASRLSHMQCRPFRLSWLPPLLSLPQRGSVKDSGYGLYS